MGKASRLSLGPRRNEQMSGHDAAPAGRGEKSKTRPPLCLMRDDASESFYGSMSMC